LPKRRILRIEAYRYRHFPRREALVEALHGNELVRLRNAADELLALRDPDVALRTCCAGSAVDQREQAGRMLDLLMDGLRARTARQVSE